MGTSQLAATMAEFGMALTYFIENVELRDTRVVYGPQVARSIIGQVFGEKAVIVTGKAPDGQTWRAIYPHEASTCWAMVQPHDTQLVLAGAGDFVTTMPVSGLPPA